MPMLPVINPTTSFIRVKAALAKTEPSATEVFSELAGFNGTSSSNVCVFISGWHYRRIDVGRREPKPPSSARPDRAALTTSQ
jgi:hypothetical protein